MGFQLVTTLRTLNDLERRNSPYFAFFFAEFDSFAGRLCHSGSTFGQNQCTLQRVLSAIAELLVQILVIHYLCRHAMGRARVMFMINVKLRVRVGSG